MPDTPTAEQRAREIVRYLRGASGVTASWRQEDDDFVAAAIRSAEAAMARRCADYIRGSTASVLEHSMCEKLAQGIDRIAQEIDEARKP